MIHPSSPMHSTSGYNAIRRVTFLTCFTLLAVRLQISGTPMNGEGELLVKWRDGPGCYDASAGNAQIGSTVKRNFNSIGWQQVKLPSGMNATDGVKAYQALNDVLAVEPNGTVTLEPPPEAAVSTKSSSFSLQSHQAPKDPLYTSQWYLRRIGAPTAWDVTTGGTNIVVAVLDRGVNFRHPDLAANMWVNPGETGQDAQGKDKSTNGIDDDDNGYIDDVHGVDVENGTGDPRDTGHLMTFDPPEHGTFCAGIIGAVGNNNMGITGLNWSARIMAIRFAGGDPANTRQYIPRAYWADNLAAWDYIIMMKRRGVNIRVTSNSYADYYQSLSVRDALALAGSENILCVFSGGNQTVDTDLRSRNPGGYNLPSVLVVAASDEADRLADFSNFGRSSVHLAAPGVNFTSTAGTNYLTGWNGTSHSCPLVAGTAALLLSLDPSLKVDQLKAAILGSVDQPSALRGKAMTHGRLNVTRALQYLTNVNSPAIVIHASPAGQWATTNAPIQVTFSRPMKRQTVEDAFVISPPVEGSFHWSADQRSFTFEHAAPFDSSTNYTVRILGSAQAESGGSLDGDYDREQESSPADDFTFTFRFRIRNDDFVNAERIAGTTGAIQSSTRFATFELMEPDHLDDRTSMSSVWYRWSAPDPGGWVSFDLTGGTSFDSLLAVYKGEEFDRLESIAGNDNHGNRASSRVSFQAIAGTVYSIAVAGRSSDETKRFVGTDQSGAFRLAWYPTPAPGFTGARFSPSMAAPGAKLTFTGTNFTGATAVLFNGANQSASFTNALTNNLDLRITAIVPPDARSGPITILTPHGNVTSLVSFSVNPPPLRLSLTPGDRVTVFWASTSPEFMLESASELGVAPWVPVKELPKLEKDGSAVTIPIVAPYRFLRLRKSIP